MFQPQFDDGGEDFPQKLVASIGGTKLHQFVDQFIHFGITHPVVVMAHNPAPVGLSGQGIDGSRNSEQGMKFVNGIVFMTDKDSDKSSKWLVIIILGLLAIGFLSVLFIAVPWVSGRGFQNLRQNMIDDVIILVVIIVFIYGFYMSTKMWPL